MAGLEPPWPVDTDFGIPTVREIPPPLPSPLGAGHLILVVRELLGLSQRFLTRAVGTSQPTLATLETGNRTPTIRMLMRVAQATGFELVIGLRRPGAPAPGPR
jgi:DNA-binding XRE family transcriptional regulator